LKIHELKRFEDTVATLQLADGEVLKAKICFVDFEYKDVIVDVIETDQPQHYRDPNASYTISAENILYVQVVP
jgi:hypothetical protein